MPSNLAKAWVNQSGKIVHESDCYVLSADTFVRALCFKIFSCHTNSNR